MLRRSYACPAGEPNRANPAADLLANINSSFFRKVDLYKCVYNFSIPGRTYRTISSVSSFLCEAMSAEIFEPAVPAPDLKLPPGEKAVTVKVINTTCFIKTTNIGRFMSPHMKGHDKLTAPAFSFLVEHESQGKTRRLVFDLGVRKDWENLSPAIVDMLSDGTWDIHTEKNVSDILTESGVDTRSIDALIWSHWHFDHTGQEQEIFSAPVTN